MALIGLIFNITNMNIDDVKKFIEIIALIVGIPLGFSQLLLLTKQFKISIKQMENQNDWNRKNVTFEYINKYTKELVDTNKSISMKMDLLNHTHKDVTFEQLEKILKDETIRSNLMNIVSYFEHLAIGVREDYFDNKIARNSLSLLTIKTYNSLMPYFELRKKELGTEICQNFKYLVERWEKERKIKKESGVDLYKLINKSMLRKLI